MKRLAILIGLVMLLLIGGGLTTQLIASGESGILPILRTTANPNADVNEMIPWKAEQFFLAVGFILFNLIGMGVTIAIIFWLLDRGIRRARAEAPPAAPAAKPSARSRAAAAAAQTEATE